MHPPTYKYKGYSYMPEEDREPDECTKIFHYVETLKEPKSIGVVLMDWSSYHEPTLEEFEVWIDLGLPDRWHPAVKSCAPLRREDLVEIAVKTGNMNLALKLQPDKKLLPVLLTSARYLAESEG